MNNYKAVMIVRDKEGNPKFDNPHNVSQAVIDSLTPKDLIYLELLKEDKNDGSGTRSKH